MRTRARFIEIVRQIRTAILPFPSLGRSKPHLRESPVFVRFMTKFDHERRRISPRTRSQPSRFVPFQPIFPHQLLPEAFKIRLDCRHNQRPSSRLAPDLCECGSVPCIASHARCFGRVRPRGSEIRFEESLLFFREFACHSPSLSMRRFPRPYPRSSAIRSALAHYRTRRSAARGRCSIAPHSPRSV